MPGGGRGRQQGAGLHAAGLRGALRVRTGSAAAGQGPPRSTPPRPGEPEGMAPAACPVQSLASGGEPWRQTHRRAWSRRRRVRCAHQRTGAALKAAPCSVTPERQSRSSHRGTSARQGAEAPGGIPDRRCGDRPTLPRAIHLHRWHLGHWRTRPQSEGTDLAGVCRHLAASSRGCVDAQQLPRAPRLAVASSPCEPHPGTPAPWHAQLLLSAPVGA
mmetsp:Transcript_4439/g.13827  ORF Transcript_4439/g.13827 Transcript_4439/m.13827 type:complete len:216 (+) Transcript_4439:2593-3240(+)